MADPVIEASKFDLQNFMTAGVSTDVETIPFDIVLDAFNKVSPELASLVAGPLDAVKSIQRSKASTERKLAQELVEKLGHITQLSSQIREYYHRYNSASHSPIITFPSGGTIHCSRNEYENVPEGIARRLGDTLCGDGFIKVAMGNQASVHIKQLEFDLSAYTLNAELAIRHRHSWGSIAGIMHGVAEKLGLAASEGGSPSPSAPEDAVASASGSDGAPATVAEHTTVSEPSDEQVALFVVRAQLESIFRDTLGRRIEDAEYATYTKLLTCYGQSSCKEAVHGTHPFAQWATEPDVRIVPGDFNGDGFMDIVLVRQSVGWATIPVALSQGDGSFSIKNEPIIGPHPFAQWATESNVQVVSGDFNGDGNTDIALVRQSGGWTTVPVALARGDGGFRIVNSQVGAFALWATDPDVRVVPGDYNGNGFMDIALVRQSAGWQSIPIASSNTDGSFTILNVTLPQPYRDVRTDCNLDCIRSELAQSDEALQYRKARNEAAIRDAYKFFVGRDIPENWLDIYADYLEQHDLEQLKDRIVAEHGRQQIPGMYRFYVGPDMSTDLQSHYERDIRRYGFEQLKTQIVADHGRHRIPEVYRGIVGAEISDTLLLHYSDNLRYQGIEGIRKAIAHSLEARIALETHYQDIRGAMAELGENDHDYYVFLLSTGDWSLAEVHDDMVAVHFQTVMVPVLSALAILQ